MAKTKYSLTNEKGNDYILNPGHTAWVTVGDRSIYITADKVEIYEIHHETDNPIVSINL